MKVPRPNIKSKISSVADKIKTENIKNKMKRADVVAKIKHDKAQKKLEMRKQRKKEEEEDPTKKEERLKKNIPKTLENTREFDETVVDVDDEEVIFICFIINVLNSYIIINSINFI